MKFITADSTDEVLSFYKEVCDAQKYDTYTADWHYGEYPSEEDLTAHTENGETFLLKDDTVKAAAVMTFREDEMYAPGHWTVSGPADRIAVVHLLAVRPGYRGKGLGDRLLDGLKSEAERRGYLSIHLDVMPDNLSARKLYERNGFVFIERLGVHYDDIGDTEVDLYEYVL